MPRGDLSQEQSLYLASSALVLNDTLADQADQPVERRISEQPNYVTASGLRQLQTQVSQIAAADTAGKAR